MMELAVVALSSTAGEQATVHVRDRLRRLGAVIELQAPGVLIIRIHRRHLSTVAGWPGVRTAGGVHPSRPLVRRTRVKAS